MDEFRENGRLRGALDASLSGLNGDPYLARRLIACAEKQPKAVRKRSIGLVFAFVALLAAVSVAAAAAINLFEQFGQSERRFAEIAPQTVIDSETASIQTERTARLPPRLPTPIMTANRCSSATQFRGIPRLNRFPRQPKN